MGLPYELRLIADAIPRDAGRRSRFALEHASRIAAVLDEVGDDGQALNEPDTDALVAVLELTHLTGVRDQGAVQASLARFASRVRCQPATRLSNAIAGCSNLMFTGASTRPGDATRAALATAAAREDAFAYGNRIFLALHALPDGLDHACTLLRGMRITKIEPAREVLSLILRQGEPVRGHAVGALFGGATCIHAPTLLPELDAEVRRTALVELTRAALTAGPPLHEAMVAIAPDHPELRPLLRWIATFGDTRVAGRAVSALASEEVGRRGITADIAAVVAKAPPDPWTPEERSGWADLSPETVAGLVRRAAAVPCSGAATARVEAALAWLAAPSRLVLPAVEAALVDAVVSGPFLLATRLVLLRALEPGVGLTRGARDRLAAAAAAEAPPGYGILRLGLPTTLDGWAAWRRAHLTAEEAWTWDQSIVLALPPEEAGPVLASFYGDCTPNQRRALVRQAALTACPAHLPGLVSLALSLDPEMAAAIASRIGALLSERVCPPTFRGAALSELQRLAAAPDPVGGAARAELKRHGDGRAGQVALAASGGEVAVVEAGGLSLAVPAAQETAATPPVMPSIPEAGAASVGVTPPVAHEPERRPGLRRLAPPPRVVPTTVLLGLALAADNGWGLLWCTVCTVGAIFFTLGASSWSTAAWTLGAGLLGMGLNHQAAATLPLWRCLRRGALALGRPDAKLETTGTGRNTTRQWRHTVHYLGDDGATHRVELVRTARTLRIGDDALEPLLVLSGPTGAPTHAVMLDAVRSVRVTPDGRLRLSVRGAVSLTLTIILIVFLILSRLS